MTVLFGLAYPDCLTCRNSLLAVRLQTAIIRRVTPVELQLLNDEFQPIKMFTM